jgi:hypothetical protein
MEDSAVLQAYMRRLLCQKASRFLKIPSFVWIGFRESVGDQVQQTKRPHLWRTGVRFSFTITIVPIVCSKLLQPK